MVMAMSSDHPPRSLDELRDESSAYLRGEIPKPDWLKTEKEPLPGIAEVLSSENTVLMKLIDDHHPCTVSELADMSGRDLWLVSRSLQDLARFGFVRLDGMWVRAEVVAD